MSIASKQFKSVVITLITVELANAIACMVDGFTIGHFMGNETMASYGLAAPFFSLIAIISGILMVSLQVLVSRYLGKGDTKKANEVFNTVFFFGIIIGLAVTALGVIFSKQIAMVFGAKGDSIGLLDLTSKALIGYFLGAAPNIVFTLLTPIVQLDGKQKLVNIAGLTSAIADIVLDLLNVYVFKLGIFGIALATTFSFILPVILLLTYFRNKEKTFAIDIKLVKFKETWSILKEGLPRGIGMAARLVGPVITNTIVLATAFTEGMAAMSVLGSIKFLIQSPGWGVAGAVLLLSGISFGERDKKGLIEVLKNALIYDLILVGVLTIIVELLAGPIARVYITDSEAVITMAIHAIRWHALALPFITLNNICANYLQATGKKVGTYLYNIGNEFAGYVIVLLIMSKLFGSEGIFMSMLVEQVLLLIIYVICAFVKKQEAKGKEKLLMLEKAFDANMEDFVECAVHSTDEVCELSSKVMSLCDDHNIDKKKSYYLGLCLEELANNVISYGFNDKKPHKLEVRVVVDCDDIILTMRDDCKSFDINKYEWAFKVDPEHPEKGIGLRIVMKAAKEVNYSYTLNTNYVIVKL